MFNRWPIRRKLQLAVVLLVAIILALSIGGFRGVYAYRGLARNISNHRAVELGLAVDLSLGVGDLRAVIAQTRQLQNLEASPNPHAIALLLERDVLDLRQEFLDHLQDIRKLLDDYKQQLQQFEYETSGDRHRQQMPEWATVRDIESELSKIRQLHRDEDWPLGEVPVEMLEPMLTKLHALTGGLPVHLEERMRQLSGEVRSQYHIWFALCSVSALLALAMSAVLWEYLRRAIFAPFRILVDGSRRVAKGDFQHRILLDTNDEVAELAAAMNQMTHRFQKIRDDLDRQVQERTREVVRSEQLASVGFLAAGVAHEINNPLAAIAMCAESLEKRFQPVFAENEEQDDKHRDPKLALMKNYLRTIQEEAFRCKGITERLLDYSRMGDVEKHRTNLGELVEGVIEMVRHLGRYRRKSIEFEAKPHAFATVNAQEIKQVVLNLVTNALDSLDAGGTVRVQLEINQQSAELTVSDDGCGMTEDVMKHLFEPFFTRRRNGQGTGLGLSITYRIVQDHGGEIQPFSKGPGLGSKFYVKLPLTEPNHEKERHLQRNAA